MIPPSGGGVAGITLDDLDWVTASLSDEPDDFWWFIRDLGDPPGIGRVFAYEAINVFEHWKVNRSLMTAGVHHDLVMFELHRGAAEYELATDRQPIEEALFVCGLPALREFDHRKFQVGDDAFLYDLDSHVGVRVIVGDFPICI
jgi:hypothetical protein